MTKKNNNDSLYLRWEHRRESILLLSLVAVIAGVIVAGWSQRTKGLISAETGFGYLLGILGASMMVFLLTYSLSKQQPILRKIMSIKRWFQLHMTLGVVGPLCILFHCNFNLGSLNSTVALVCMLLVAASGIIGRYFYTQIHYGIHGQHIELRDVISDCEKLHVQLRELSPSEREGNACDSVFSDLLSALRRSINEKEMSQRRIQKGAIKRSRQRLKKLIFDLRESLSDSDSQELGHIQVDLKRIDRVTRSIMNRVVGLAFFEKLFSIWHVVHIPIFFVMLLTAIVHVVVVHMY